MHYRYTYNGVEGYEVTGTNGNSIFFPACGYILGGDFLKSDLVFFWSSTSDIVYFQDYVIVVRQVPDMVL